MTRGSETPSQKSVGASGLCDQPETEDDDDVERDEDDLETGLRPAEVRLEAARVGDEGVAGVGESGAALPARDEEERVLTMVAGEVVGIDNGRIEEEEGVGVGVRKKKQTDVESVVLEKEDTEGGGV